ncbi:MAG: aminoacyl-tRNA hydrolase [Bacteroidales bacterium]|nr:aminoacyl-tRNA hydrolase [Bacteroidales bacterium]
MKYLIVGLGNIGDEYANTRHNIGFIVLDALAQSLGAKFSIGRHASVAECRVKNKEMILLKPTTYMNLSGKAVKYWLDKEKIPLENLLVITDDVDLDLGVLRMRSKGSGGSHNGLNHIIETLITTDWSRLRFGIGKDYAKGFQVDYVLGKWSSKDEKILLPRIDLAVDMIKSFVLAGVNHTMSEFNNK